MAMLRLLLLSICVLYIVCYYEVDGGWGRYRGRYRGSGRKGSNVGYIRTGSSSGGGASSTTTCGGTICKNGGTCRSGGCKCKAGWKGASCDTKQKCGGKRCWNGKCKDGKCQCNVGWKGTKCDRVQSCNRRSCRNGICKDGKCQCNVGWKGTKCDRVNSCDPKICKHGNCKNNKCICTAGWTTAGWTKRCNKDVDECSTGKDTCSPFAECENTKGSYSCVCKTGYLGNGETCKEIEKCTDNICGVGVCKETNGEISCNCTDTGYWGEFCKYDINECDMNLCRRGSCKNFPGGYSCTCQAGFTGKQCDTDIDECSIGETCGGGNVKCRNFPGSFVCHCERGYYWSTKEKKCKNIDECHYTPCEQLCEDNEGSFQCSCVDGCVVSSTNPAECDIAGQEARRRRGDQTVQTMSNYYYRNYQYVNDADVLHKAAKEGETRKRRFLQKEEKKCGVIPCAVSSSNPKSCLRCRSGFELLGGDCRDINECGTAENRTEEGPCPNAVCVNVPGTFFCDCNEGYIYSPDTRTCYDLNECLSNNVQELCGDHSQCTNTDGSFECKCGEGLYRSGRHCSDIDECREDKPPKEGEVTTTVQNRCSSPNQVCHNVFGTFSCSCEDGHFMTKPLEEPPLCERESDDNKFECSSNGDQNYTNVYQICKLPWCNEWLTSPAIRALYCNDNMGCRDDKDCEFFMNSRYEEKGNIHEVECCQVFHKSNNCPKHCRALTKDKREEIITSCMYNRWGPKCERECNCYEGMPCDIDQGHCLLCPVNKTSLSCEADCPEHCGGRCYRLTGACCEKSFWGHNCSEMCHCYEGDCDKVTGECTSSDHCKNGYYGEKCNLVCHYYGAPNKTHRCLDLLLGAEQPPCDRNHGFCCQEGYWGPSCSKKCHNCIQESPCEYANGECLFGCKSFEKWGPECNKSCPSNCPGGPCITHTGECCPEGKFGIGCHYSCKGCTNGCNPKNGDCKVDEEHDVCENGFYLEEKQCKLCHCKNNDPCNKETGDCNDKGGCARFYYGDKCSKHCEHCMEGCDKKSGNCLQVTGGPGASRCMTGYTGEGCNEPCALHCLRNKQGCDQENGRGVE